MPTTAGAAATTTAGRGRSQGGGAKANKQNASKIDRILMVTLFPFKARKETIYSVFFT